MISICEATVLILLFTNLIAVGLLLRSVERARHAGMVLKMVLAALAIGGQARQYLVRSIGAEQIDAMEPEEVEKLYTRYEACLGATMTKTLGQAAIQLYATAAGSVLPIPPHRQPRLAEDLEADPFVSHAVSCMSAELYFRFGMYLAPLTAALATAKHCDWQHQFGQGPGFAHRDGERRDSTDTAGARDDAPNDGGGSTPYPGFDETG